MTKLKAQQILHGRNTLQKYVGNREQPKSTQKVLKNQKGLKIKTLWLVSHSKLWLVIRL